MSQSLRLPTAHRRQRSGAKLCAFEGLSLDVGPVISYEHPIGNMNLRVLADAKTGPDQMVNLAANSIGKHDLVSAMSAKLEAIIKTEMGKDDGRELPNIPLVDWTIDRVS